MVLIKIFNYLYSEPCLLVFSLWTINVRFFLFYLSLLLLLFCYEFVLRVGAITKDTMDISFIKIFIEGPEVSLKGSPTVSPVTDALCGSDSL